MLAFRRRLLKQHEEHVLLGVDHHIAAAGAVPDKKASLNFRIVRRAMTSNSLFTGSPLQLPVGLGPWQLPFWVRLGSRVTQS